MKLSFTLNGRAVQVAAAPDQRAVDLLRELDALDVKEGCGTGECGACSVLVDGVHKLSCLLLAAQLQGRELTTAAGLGGGDPHGPHVPHPIQRAFAEQGAVQCGFCTPGMTIAAAALLAENPAPTRLEVRRGISGNLCRCTGYVKIVDAVRAAALELADVSVDVSADVPAEALSAASDAALAYPAGETAGDASSVVPGAALAAPAGDAPGGAFSVTPVSARVRAKGRTTGSTTGSATGGGKAKAGGAA